MLKKRRRGPIYYGLPEPDISKSVRRTIVNVGILLIVTMAAGFIYIMQSDKNNTRPIATTVATKLDSNTVREFKPIKPALNEPESAAVEAFSSLAKPGGPASISIKTKPGSTCTIEILYNNVPVHEGGMQPAIADDWGTITWNWTVSRAAPTGMWPINMNCKDASGKTAFLQANLQVDN